MKAIRFSLPLSAGAERQNKRIAGYWLFLPDRASPMKTRSKHQEDDAYARGIAREVNYCDDEERDAC
jgi:hypothetical protein